MTRSPRTSRTVRRPRSLTRGPGRRPPLAVTALLLLLVCSLAAPETPAIAQPVSREYQIKAAFLYNFTKFVDWPPERFETGDSPIVIGVLGRNPFGDELSDVVEGREVNGRGLIARNLESPDDIEEVHLLFVASGEESLLDGSLDTLHESGVLTVGESEAFRDLGGIVTFTLQADRIRFFINRDSAREAELRISAQLLQLALASR